MTLAPGTQYSLLALAALLAAAGCRNLDDFDTKPGQAYCGSLIAEPLFQDGFLPNGARARIWSWS